MVKFFNLRGTSGSGKTTVARALLNETNAQPILFNETGKKVRAYRGDYKGVPFFLLGSYAATCGGMDSITDINDQIDLLNKFKGEPQGVVFFEGLLMSHSIGTIGAFMKQFGNNALTAFLDTPLDTCLERVKGRRLARGNLTEFNPTNTTKDHASVLRCKQRMIEAGFPVATINHTDSINDVKRYLDAATKGDF